MYGYCGKMLEIDLSSGRIKTVPVKEEDARLFIGGKGLGAKILYNRLKGGEDPLGPENPLIFIAGPLTGTEMPTSGRFTVVTKSPLTGLFLDSHVGGFFGPEMRLAGYDGIIIHGKSGKPVYIEIKGDEIDIKDASHLWGKTTSETTEAIRKAIGSEKARVAAIGPAGERLVKYAMINIDTYKQKERGGQAGRGGAGAVMGSKNLKALAILTENRSLRNVVKYADEDRFRKVARECMKKVAENDFIRNHRRVYGTPLWINPMSHFGILPTRNFQTGTFEYADNISGERMRETIVVEDKACYMCPIFCGKHSVVKEGKYKGTELEGPEYELLALLGSDCYIGSLEAVAKASLLVDEL